jgi:hypothetical protein
MPLTDRGFESDPLAPLAWDLLLASLGFAKLADGAQPRPKELTAITEVGQVLTSVLKGPHVTITDLMRAGGGPPYYTETASFAALTTIRGAIEDSRLPAFREAVATMVDVSALLQAGRQDVDAQAYRSAHETAVVLLNHVNDSRPDN